MSCETVENLDKTDKYATVSPFVFDQLKALNLNVELVKTNDYTNIVSNKLTAKSHINQLEPLYLRKSQAELQREAKVGNNGKA